MTHHQRRSLDQDLPALLPVPLYRHTHAPHHLRRRRCTVAHHLSATGPGASHPLPELKKCNNSQALARYASDMACVADAEDKFAGSKGSKVMRGMMSRLLGDWNSAAEAYAAAVGGAAADMLPESLKMWLTMQLDELRALKQQQQQQQQQQYTWHRARSLARVTPPGGDGSIYISIVMVGRHDNTQVYCDL